MPDSSPTSHELRGGVEKALNDRLDLWRENTKWAAEHIDKPDIAKTNSVIAVASLVGVGMQAASAFVPRLAVPLAIPTFLLADAAAAFQGYYRQRMERVQQELNQAEDEITALLRNRIDGAHRRFKGGTQYREIRDFMAHHLANRHGVAKPEIAFGASQKALHNATIKNKAVIPADNLAIKGYASRHYGEVCRQVYTIYRRINPETIAEAAYPPFIRARNRTGKFRSIGELEAFCTNPKRGNVGCEPDVEAYVVQGGGAGPTGEKRDFAVLLGHAWMLKLVPRPTYQRAARATPMPGVTHMEIVPVEREPIRPVWTGVGRTKEALAQALDAAVPEVREDIKSSA